MWRTWEIDTHTFLRVWMLFSNQIHILWYTLWYEIFRMGIAWEIGTHFLPRSVGTFLPSDSYLWYILINGKHTAFSHQFLIARENAAKSTLWAPRLFFRSMIVSICSIIWWFLKRVNRKKWLGNFLFLKKRKINSRHPEIQSKIYQKKKRT